MRSISSSEESGGKATSPLSQAVTVATEKAQGTVMNAEWVQREEIPVWAFVVFTRAGKESGESGDAGEG
jgi:hypothetical protein